MRDENNIIYLTDYLEDSHKIVTSEHGQQQFSALKPTSALTKRGIALLLDLAAMGVIYAMLFNGYAIFVSEFLSPLTYGSRFNLLQGDSLLALAVFLPLYFSYFLYCTFVMNGKTLGKMATGLRVIKEDFIHDQGLYDYQLSLADAFQRASGYLLCYLSFGLFFIFNFASEDRRGLPDYLSSSRTVTDAWLQQMLAHKQTQEEQLIIDISQLDQQDDLAA